MKTVFRLENNEIKSELIIKNKNNTTTKAFYFDYLTLNNWYPLNNEYELVYNIEQDNIQLVSVSRTTIMNNSYGLSDSKQSLDCSIPKNNFDLVIPSVRADNTQTCKLAKDFGMPCWLDDSYTLLDVQISLRQLHKKLDELTSYLVELYYFDLPQDKQVNFLAQTKDNKERLALKDISDSDQQQYTDLGKLYTMLSVMRKVSRLNA